MVGELHFFDHDPNPRKRRGAGDYYHRGKGQWSKYGGAGFTREKRNIAKTRVKSPLRAHTGDMVRKKGWTRTAKTKRTVGAGTGRRVKFGKKYTKKKFKYA